TSDRAHLSTPIDPDADLAARALFFTIADAPKPDLALAELARAHLLPQQPVILDVGAGCGGWGQTLGSQTSVFAALSGRDAHFAVRAIDRDRRALQIYEAAMAALPWRDRTRLTLVHGDAGRAELGPPADVIVASGVLNEIGEEPAFELLRRLLAQLAGGGSLIIVEPALREVTRALHRLRDRVLAGGLAHVFAPCIRQGPCPALVDPDDWCHEDRPTELPPRAAELAQVTGLRRHGLKFAYLVLRGEPAAQVPEPPAPRRALRAVSRLEVSKGKRQIIGCGHAGWVDVRLLKRRRSDANRAFEDARRGDVIVVGAADDIGAGDVIDRISVDGS
ncbi:MAG TPA: small ribosomal subunit Rsm22 family protein, partial [Kofleriaceae bacterium]|nr:small ribosomal subunit Rsm22 family protein [Kofleriaceae bacterium]